jgi:PAS domain S-box-containing protein
MVTGLYPKPASRWWPLACGLYAAVGGLISLSGWLFNVERLTDWLNTGISIQPNAALATALAGAALIALTNGYPRLAAALASAVAVIGGTVLFQTLTGVNLGIDGLLVLSRDWGGQSVKVPGRMGTPAALSWTVIGGALIFASLPRMPRRIRAAAPAAATLTAAVAGLSLIGYLFGASKLYSLTTSTAIAFQTSTFVLIASLGVMLAVPEHGPARLFRDDSAAGAMFRRTLPALVLVPIVMGYVQLHGERLGLFDEAFGTALRTVTAIAILLVVVTWTSRDVGDAERQQRMFEQRLVEREALLSTVTEEGEVGLVIVDRDHRYAYANRSYCEIVRVDQDGLIGRHVSEVLPEVYEWRIRPKIDRAFAGEIVSYELHLPERQQYVSVTYQPVWRHGIVSQVIAAIVDTTERRRVEDVLQTSRVELEEAARRKDEFLMMLAHELRNPLAPMRTAVDLMKRSQSAADLTRARDVIDRQLSLMTRLLDDLLDMGRIARDTLTLRKARVDLAAVVRDSVEISQPLADRYQQTLAVSLPDERIDVDADPARLEQVVANLLNNACRFTQSDGRVEVSVARDGADAVIRVKDSGIGIAAGDLSRIFERFAQLDRSIDRAQGGLGIGLHLVKRLVELHDGTVEARSDGPSRGSEFIVRLPVAPSLGGIPACPPAAAPAGFSPRRILVVDDNVDAANAMSMLLSFSGHEAHVAHDGPAALEAVAAFAPEVVLLDLGLPGMSGFDVCRQIRTATTARRPLIVALTGWGQESDRRKSRESGFDHHLVKPVDYEALADLLSRAAL